MNVDRSSCSLRFLAFIFKAKSVSIIYTDTERDLYMVDIQVVSLLYLKIQKSTKSRCQIEITERHCSHDGRNSIDLIVAFHSSIGVYAA
jgi:hypothetical protein